MAAITSPTAESTATAKSTTTAEATGASRPATAWALAIAEIQQIAINFTSQETSNVAFLLIVK
jgi:hypothetical protein